MLYDILPPLFFFGSFGGIIAVVSRVVLRIRRQQLSTEIQDSGRIEQKEETVLNPSAKKVTLFRSRLSLVPSMMKRTIGQTRDLVSTTKKKLKRQAGPAEVKAELKAEMAPLESEATVTKPSAGRMRALGSAWQRRQAAVATWGKKVGRNIPTTLAIKGKTNETHQAKTLYVAKTPVKSSIRLVTEAPKEEAKKIQASDQVIAEKKPDDIPSEAPTPRIIAGLLQRKKQPANDAIQRASLALEEGDLTKVEDILVPYLIEHTHDASAYLILGQAALEREAWEEAIEIFQQVLKINEREAGVLAALGHAALESGHFTLALQSLQRAHDEDSNNFQVLEDLLTIAERQDNPVLRKSVTEQMKALNTNNPKAAEKVGSKA